MKKRGNLLNKSDLQLIIENISVSKNDLIFIHHPITKDLIHVKVEKSTSTNVIVSIPENSHYFGQPNFKVEKYKILGIKYK